MLFKLVFGTTLNSLYKRLIEVFIASISSEVGISVAVNNNELIKSMIKSVWDWIRARESISLFSSIGI
jgi:hypothetical protein